MKNMKKKKEKKRYIEAKVLSPYNSRLVCYVEHEIAIPNDFFFSHGTFFFPPFSMLDNVWDAR
jgi:hypothetical protein